MTIHEFQLRLRAEPGDGGLLAALRRLCNVESPQTLWGDGSDSTVDWILWGGGAGEPHPAPVAVYPADRRTLANSAPW